MVQVWHLDDELMWGEVLNLCRYDLLAKLLEKKAATWAMNNERS